MIKQAINFFRYTVLSILLMGCTHFAGRPYACDSAYKSMFGFPAGAWVFIGNTFQVGDCSLSKHFKIETGEYYSEHKFNIDNAVDNFEHVTMGTGETLSNFAKSYNCPNEYHRLFSERLSENKEKIFGKDFSRSARQVSNAVQNMIDADNELKRVCD